MLNFSIFYKNRLNLRISINIFKLMFASKDNRISVIRLKNLTFLLANLIDSQLISSSMACALFFQFLKNDGQQFNRLQSIQFPLNHTLPMPVAVVTCEVDALFSRRTNTTSQQ